MEETTPRRKPTAKNLEDALAAELKLLRRDVDRLNVLVDGDDKLSVTGLRVRVKSMEEVLQALSDERRATKNLLTGVTIGLGLTGVTSAGTLVTVIRLLAGT